jgi:uncharacterized membrane-anchored protein YhcB (DUF1043 family)
MNEIAMLWLGLIVGLFIGTNVALFILSRCRRWSRKEYRTDQHFHIQDVDKWHEREDEIDRQIRSNFPTSPD